MEIIFYHLIVISSALHVDDQHIMEIILCLSIVISSVLNTIIFLKSSGVIDWEYTIDTFFIV